MKNTGWVRLWRGQFDSWVSKKPFCDGYAWCYLYATANHKAGTVNFRNEYIKIERGQFLTSKLQLQKRFSWTYRHVENFLKALQNDEMITYRTVNRYTIINIVNYERFQSKPDGIVEQSEEQIDNRVITERKQGNTNKNVKNEKNDKKRKVFDFIYLTEIEHNKLLKDYGLEVTDTYLHKLDDYIGVIGEDVAKKKYKSHYHVIKSWYRKDKK